MVLVALIVNNTRFAILDDAGGYPNLGSHVLKLICRRISDDWQSAGQSAGYSHGGGKFTEAHDQTKRLLLRPLRRDTRRILC